MTSLDLFPIIGPNARLEYYYKTLNDIDWVLKPYLASKLRNNNIAIVSSESLINEVTQLLINNQIEHVGPLTQSINHKLTAIDTDENGINKIHDHKSWLKYLQSIYAENSRDFKASSIFYQLFILQQKIKPYPLVLETSSFSFTQEERNSFIRAIELYKAYYTIYTSDPLKVKVLSTYSDKKISKSSFEEILHFTTEITTALMQVKLRILEGTKQTELDQLKLLKEETNNTLLDIHKEESSLTSFILEFGDSRVEKPGMLSFDTKKKTKYAKWSLLRVETNNPLEAINQLQRKKDNVKLSYQQKRTELESSYKGLNELNTQDQDLLSAARALNDILDQINQFGIFKNKVECNTKNFIKKIPIIDGIIEDLEVLLKCNDIKDAIAWIHLKDHYSNSFLNMISQLKSIPMDEWVDQFEYSYLNKWLDHHSLSLQFETKINSEWQNYYGLINNSIINSIINSKWNQFREIIKSDKPILKALKSSNLIFPLLKSKKIDAPILLVPLSKKDLIPESYSMVYIGGSSDTTYDTAFILDESESDIPSKLNLQNTLKELPSSHQLSIAKQLSSNLKPFSGRLKGFQLKSCNIMVSLPEPWDNLISSSIINEGGKFFDLSIQDNLTDFLLSTDRPSHCLIFDSIIDYSSQSFNQQLLILTQMEKLGFQIKSLFTNQILDQPNFINHVIQRIIQHSE